MNVATMVAHHPPVAKPGLVRRLLTRAKNFLIGSLLCTNPFTGLLVLGFILRRMRWLMGKEVVQPRWLIGQGESTVGKLTGGLRANFRSGLASLFTLAAASLPFTALWALAWWAGWENSFNKGYEQSAVGPLLSLLAVAVSLPILSLLPMALAHQAAEGNWRSFFVWRNVRRLVHLAGWRYAALVVATTVLALPFLFFTTGRLFIEDMFPTTVEFTPKQFAALKLQLLLVQSAYVFVSLLVLRQWAARCHVRAHAMQQGDPDRKSSLLLRAIYGLIMWAASFGLVAQIYVAQFFNHGWLRWFSHPFFFVPTLL